MASRRNSDRMRRSLSCARVNRAHAEPLGYNPPPCCRCTPRAGEGLCPDREFLNGTYARKPVTDESWIASANAGEVIRSRGSSYGEEARPSRCCLFMQSRAVRRPRSPPVPCQPQRRRSNLDRGLARCGRLKSSPGCGPCREGRWESRWPWQKRRIRRAWR